MTWRGLRLLEPGLAALHCSAVHAAHEIRPSYSWECPNFGTPKIKPQLMISFTMTGRRHHFFIFLRIPRQVAMISRVREHDQLHVKLEESACRCLLPLRRWDELALALSELTSSGKGIFCHGAGSCYHGSKGLEDSSCLLYQLNSPFKVDWMD